MNIQVNRWINARQLISLHWNGLQIALLMGMEQIWLNCFFFPLSAFDPASDELETMNSADVMLFFMVEKKTRRDAHEDWFFVRKLMNSIGMVSNSLSCTVFVSTVVAIFYSSNVCERYLKFHQNDETIALLWYVQERFPLWTYQIHQKNCECFHQLEKV